MSVKADIDWIKSQLDQIDDPGLIGGVNAMLELKQREDLRTQMILEGEEEILRGALVPHASLEEQMGKWRSKKK